MVYHDETEMKILQRYSMLKTCNANSAMVKCTGCSETAKTLQYCLEQVSRTVQ